MATKKTTRKTVASVSKELEAVKSKLLQSENNFAELNEIHLSSSEEYMNNVIKLSTQLSELEKQNLNLTGELAVKDTALDLLKKELENFIKAWNSTAKFLRFFVALSFINKFVAIFREALNTKIEVE